MGKVSLTQNRGFLSIDSLNCFGSQHGIGNVFTLYCNSLDGRLFFNIAYVYPMTSDETALRFITRLETILKTAAHNSSFTLADVTRFEG